MANNLKIRMFRNRRALDSTYIAIDDFSPFAINTFYMKGAKLYFTEYRNGRMTKGKVNKNAKMQPIQKLINDVYELPSVEDYRLLSEALKRSGMIFNKKKGCFSEVK